ncbi:uncharacterized protein LOC18445411 [Amborella trichopoda]|uniref:FYVE-type domain-containing protein n=1 Tax=Amborella trichopoda TaxID=13333 RepID=U5D9N0_AMBTC|nr:uncharacterized protein LOC18445411 [Amborella trichopoda]ERN17078.1 hypothetical protein AMTR_s00044p00073920 [Amborella trichopoda]|eukprot:XP_006855611.1 uncharacterized protein LOC18445411 [Amborella trichopoda]
MGESGRTTPVDRDIEQAIISLKKGAHLLKYGSRGRPKFCPFRLSTDEKVLIWFSGKEEKQLKLSSISKIIPGQRTERFQRQPQPEKEYRSCSLIYGNGQSLDLICKDKEQAEAWFVGLQALVSRSRHFKISTKSCSDGGVHSYSNSPASHVRRKQNSGFQEDSAKHSQDTIRPVKVPSLYGSPSGSSKEKSDLEYSLYSLDMASFSEPRRLLDAMLTLHEESDHFSKQMGETALSEEFKINLPSGMSSSSMEERDSLSDVLMWGEGIEGATLGGGIHRSTSTSGIKFDALIPKLLDSTGMLDVRSISCGRKHAALITKHGEVFCWGEERNGRLGHKIDMDVSHPKVVESLSSLDIESVACGEYHTCALTDSGELYTWGGSSPCEELSGNKSQWFTRKVLGPVEGISISGISCGAWHTAVVSTSGQLFTYGDGSFGTLGHGDLKNYFQPREVESLKGLRVKWVACGSWHTAAIVDIIADHSRDNLNPGTHCGKLFTWGDSDKGRLGHQDKERKLLPTCVASLVEHDFVQVACGEALTISLTSLGKVCTMGAFALAEGKSASVVEGKLNEEFVKMISCGSYHVAVLTSEGEVYTWGRGVNGQLGHGDVEDRNSATLVEALRDRKVKSVACGSNFTAVICSHKPISSIDQSVCTGCRMVFGFTRKRHNCYNCGFVFCHACSSKKAMHASLAPSKRKPYRVCDPCFSHLKRFVDSSLNSETPSSRKLSMMQKVTVPSLKLEKTDTTFVKPQLLSPKLYGYERNECLERETLNKQGRNAPDPSLLCGGPRWGQVACPPQFSLYNKENSLSLAIIPAKNMPQGVSSFPKEQSHPKAVVGISHSANSSIPNFDSKDSKESNKVLAEELQRLHAQATNLQKQCQLKDEKIQHYKKRIEETWSLASEEAARCKAAKEVIKALTLRLREMSEKLSSEKESTEVATPRLLSIVYRPQTERESTKVGTPRLLDIVNGPQTLKVSTKVVPQDLEDLKSMDDNTYKDTPSVRAIKDKQTNGLCSSVLPSHDMLTNSNGRFHSQTLAKFADGDDQPSSEGTRENCKKPENGCLSEWVEQDEPGVYITLRSLPSGQKELKRVRFSRKKFTEKEAERWWSENRSRVHRKYNIDSIGSGTNSMRTI